MMTIVNVDVKKFNDKVYIKPILPTNVANTNSVAPKTNSSNITAVGGSSIVSGNGLFSMASIDLTRVDSSTNIYFYNSAVQYILKLGKVRTLYPPERSGISSTQEFLFNSESSEFINFVLEHSDCIISCSDLVV